MFSAALALSPVQLGVLVSIPTLSGAVLRIPFGAWTDKVGGRLPMLSLLGSSIVGLAGLTALLFATPDGHLGASDLGLLLALGALSGAGVASFSVGVHQVANWTPRARQGRALGFFGGFGNLAPGVFTLLVPLATSQVGLTGAYVVWLAILTGGTVTYALLARDSPWFQLQRRGFAPGDARGLARRSGQESFPPGDAFASLRASFRNRRTWALVFLYFASFGTFAGLAAWLPTFWTSFGWTPVTAALAAALGFALVSPILRVEGGLLSDWWTGERVALAGFSLLGVGGGLVAARVDATVALAGIGLIAVGAGISSAAVFKLVPRYIPEAIGGAAGWIGGLGAFGGFVVPLLLAVAVEEYGSAGYALGFLLFPFLSSGAIVVSFRLRGSEHATVAHAADAGPGPAALAE